VVRVTDPRRDQQKTTDAELREAEDAVEELCEDALRALTGRNFIKAESLLSDAITQLRFLNRASYE
jgi:hypothetical protein